MAHSRLVAMASASTISASTISTSSTPDPSSPSTHLDAEPALPVAPSSRPYSSTEKTVNEILSAAQKLLVTLNAWSVNEATREDVSDVYVSLVTGIIKACKKFKAKGVDVSDCEGVGDQLRKVLETALGQVACPENLNIYMPMVREISVRLIVALKKKALRSVPAVVPLTPGTPAPGTPAPARQEGAPADLWHHVNAVTRAREPSAIKSLYKYFMVPGMTNLAGGLPFPGYFPFDTLASAVSTASRFVPPTTAQINALSPTAPSTQSSLASFFSFGNKSTPSTEKSIHFTIPKYAPPTVAPDARSDVATALQYGMPEGFGPLRTFIREFTLNHLHGGRIPYSNPGPDILLTCGNTDGFGKAISLLGSEGDNMLVEEYTYPNSIQTAAPYGIGIVPIAMDDEGILPSSLCTILATWDTATQGKRPHILYTVTVGQNPTGGTLTLPRRKELYDLCSTYDIIIVEDDPYWHLQYTPSSHAPGPFLDVLTPSFLTLDTDGRVVRLDTFSKTIAPGCRLGWITAQAPLIERLLRITEASTQAPSGFSQAMVSRLLDAWGMDGWITWLSSLRLAYESRMTSMCSVLNAHSSTVITRADPTDGVLLEKVDMYSFTMPMGGMFVWVRMHLDAHPAYNEFVSRGHTKRQMMEALWGYVAVVKKALPCPGWTFAAEEGKGVELLRFCFAAVEEGVIGEATGRWAKGVEEFWGLGVEEVEEWLEKEGEKGVEAGECIGWERGVVGGGC